MKPDQSIIPQLLEKHALGICTPEEMAVLQQWYAAFPESTSPWRDDEETAAMKTALKAAIFDAIAPEQAHQSSPAIVKMPRRRRWWPAVAAAAALLVAFVWYQQSNGKKQPTYVLLNAPVGKKIVKFQLPDQSEVWLEPGTTLRYQNDFGNDNRDIELTSGMAYFSVRKHLQQPFVVKAPKGVQTKVLGTQFTVKAYPQAAEVQVMVSEGVVEVADSSHVLGILKANQQLSYQPQTHTAKQTAGIPDDWRSGSIALNNAAFAEVVHLLENRYGLQVIYNSADVAAYRFNLRINSNLTAAETLELLKDISGLTYTLESNSVTIH